MSLKIGGKIYIGVGLVILLTVIISGTSFFELNNINETYTDLLDNETAEIMATKDLLVETQNVIMAAQGYLYSEDPNLLEHYEQGKTKLKETTNKVEIAFEHAEEKALMSEIKAAQINSFTIFDQIVVAIKQGNDYSHLSMSAEKAVQDIIKANNDLTKITQSNVDMGHDRVENTVSGARTVIIILSIVSILAGFVIAIAAVRNITKPLSVIQEAAKIISEGDLTKEEITIKNKDEIGELAKAFNIMVGNLKSLIKEANLSSDYLSSASQQLSASAEQTSTAATETAQTISEFSNGIQQIAVNAQEAAQASIETNKLAEEGGHGVDAGVAQMRIIEQTVDKSANVIKELGVKSQSISQIVELITNIADQTNLLALNAAIEAARAGEQGKGFAVVAEEVRKLAEQSANAAKEITQLISEIQGETQEAVIAMEKGIAEVSAGSTVIDSLGDNFKNIIETARNLAFRVQEVSAASQQMAASIENIAAAAEEQTASMEEVTASTVTLTRTAEALQKVVGKFTI